MLSLNNAFGEQELRDFDQRVRGLLEIDSDTTLNYPGGAQIGRPCRQSTL